MADVSIILLETIKVDDDNTFNYIINKYNKNLTSHYTYCFDYNIFKYFDILLGLFIKKKIYINTFTIKELFLKACANKYKILEIYYKYNILYDKGFVVSCINNNIDAVKLLINKNIYYDIEYCFCISCSLGYLNLIKILYNTGLINKTCINIGFNNSCVNNYINIVMWLYTLSIDIDYIEKGYISAHKKNNRDIINWIETLNFKGHYIKYIDNNIVYEKKKIIINKTINLNIDEDCCICYNKVNLLLTCNHYLCESCVNRYYILYNNSFKCPVCRFNNYYSNLKRIIIKKR